MAARGAWPPPPSSAGARTIEEGLREVERRLVLADHALFRAEWALALGGPSGPAVLARLSRARLLSHPDLPEWCREAQRRAASRTGPRRLELLRRQAVAAQLEHHPALVRRNARIERQVLAYRPRWNARKVRLAEVGDLVSREEDPARRRAGFYANEPLYATLEPEVRELLGARNARAQELGFSSYPEARLGLEGLSVRELGELMEPLCRLGVAVSRSLRERSGSDGWYPWNMMHAQWQQASRVAGAFPGRECVAAVRDGLREWGFGPADLSFRFRRADTPTGGRAILGDTPRDVGVLARPGDGLLSYSILFHEMGHGVHGRSVRGTSPLVRRVGLSGFDESIGGLFESVTSETSWLRSRAGISREEASRLRVASYEGLAFRMAELTGEVLTELRLYERPDAELDDERRRFLRTMLAFDDHPPVSWVDPYHLSPGFHRWSYLAATCFGEQVFSAARTELGGELWPNPRWGAWLKRTWLRPGQRDDWVPKVRAVTGDPLGPVAFVERVRQETMGGGGA